MEIKKYIFLIGLLLFAFACNEEAASSNVNSSDKPQSVTKENKLKRPPNCKLSGKVLNKNQLWLKEHQQLFCIAATKSTKDKQFGNSHRMVQVIGADCNLLFEQELPVNRSPDFPYYIADINYSHQNRLIAIKGFDKIYCYDAERKKMLAPLQPQFANAELIDAQSGRILHLELWEQYLVGFAQDLGTFVFDLNEPEKASPVIPMTANTASLFALSSEDNLVQIIAPRYDIQKKTFEVNPLLEEPEAIDTQTTILDNQKKYAIVSAADKKILIDLSKQTSRVIPNNIQNKKDKEIFNWAKQ